MLSAISVNSLFNITKGHLVVKFGEEHYIQSLAAHVVFQQCVRSDGSNTRVCCSAISLLNRVGQYPLSYSSRLFVSGLGFRANVISKWLLFRLGYSHVITCSISSMVHVWVYKRYCIQVSSFYCSSTAALVKKLIAFRKTDVYKGKGVRLLDKIQKIKPGKKE